MALLAEKYNAKVIGLLVEAVQEVQGGSELFSEFQPEQVYIGKDAAVIYDLQPGQQKLSRVLSLRDFVETYLGIFYNNHKILLAQLELVPSARKRTIQDMAWQASISVDELEKKIAEANLNSKPQQL